jgi:nitroreductase
MIPAAVETLVRHAALAPSGDNAQPWRFIYRPGSGTLAVEIDEARVDSPKSLWQFVARLSCGAALENLLRAAPCLGLDAAPVAPGSGEACRVRLQPSAAGRGPPQMLDLIRRRATNRAIYAGKPVSAESAARVSRAAASVGATRIVWIRDPARIRALSRPVYEIDAAMYGIRPIWKSIERRIRFDRPWGEEVRVGLSRGALELPALKLWAIRRLGRLPHAWLRDAGLVRAFARRTLALVRSAGAVCYIVADDDRPEADIEAGRSVQSAWLALTAEGLSAHPMNSIALMEHVLRHGEPNLRRRIEATPMRRHIAQFRALVPEAGEGRSVFLMRFGHAPPPPHRNGRLPLEAVLRIAYDAPAPALPEPGPSPPALAPMRETAGAVA